MNTRQKSPETDLKSSIIEFMRERPFLWNSKHPNYKDHKKREQEFQSFSQEIKCPVQEIKRVWHVLRTNFFRAHKLLLERPQSNGENGEKLWKYYLAMNYILEGTVIGDDSLTRQLRNSRTSDDYGGDQLKKGLDSETNNNSNDTLDKESNGDSSCSNQMRKTSLNGNTTSMACNKRSHRDLSLEEDEDNLYARSLTSTLKRFDPTTKEILKLKFQEIIVSYMKTQQKQQQQQHPDETPEACERATLTTHDSTTRS